MRKKMLAPILLALALAVPAAAEEWFSNGPLTNPAANAILADTGPYSVGGPSSICIRSMVVASTVTAIIILEHRDATNTSTVHSQGMPVPANSSMIYPSICVILSDQERIRIRLNTGTVWGSIHP